MKGRAAHSCTVQGIVSTAGSLATCVALLLAQPHASRAQLINTILNGQYLVVSLSPASASVLRAVHEVRDLCMGVLMRQYTEVHKLVHVANAPLWHMCLPCGKDTLSKVSKLAGSDGMPVLALATLQVEIPALHPAVCGQERNSFSQIWVMCARRTLITHGTRPLLHPRHPTPCKGLPASDLSR